MKKAMIFNRVLQIGLLLGLAHSLVLGQSAQLPPKLVVGIVVDQMRQDYIYRFWDHFGEGGFKKLVQAGYSFENTHYDYANTYTGPGHSHIFTGAMPAVSGIIANEWFERESGKVVYCADDKSVKTIGSPSDAVGQMSPRRMLGTTIGDEMKLWSNNRSKVIGISLKDRGAILSTGHLADAAYWFDGLTGNFVSSSYYMETLPAWVTNFNKQEYAEQYLKLDWNTLLPLSTYTTFCNPDNSPDEGKFKGQDKPVFPYSLAAIRPQYNSDLIRSLPAGMTITVDFALAAIEQEGLGTDSYADMVVISFSTTDYVGHQFGPRSVELADTYLRLDMELARLLTYLEKKMGENNFLVVLSADHAAADSPKWLEERRIPSGNFRVSADSLQAISRRLFKAELVLAFENLQVYFDLKKLKALSLSYTDVCNAFAAELLHLGGVSRVATAGSLNNYGATESIMQMVERAYYPRRSGDVVLVLDPGWVDMAWQTTGTTHGSPYTYDTRVPMLWYGNGIKPGSTSKRASVADIAPTLALRLNTNLPSGSLYGQPLNERLWRKKRK